VLQHVVGIFCIYVPIKAAISLFMDACDHAPLILPKMEDPKMLTLRCHSFSSRGREHFAFSLYFKDGQYFVYDSN